MCIYNKQSIDGFTLIELMIVVAIIGLLASLGVAIYSGYDCKVKQAEAKRNLSHIYNAQSAYYTENSHYAISLTDIGFSIKGSTSGWYQYEAGGNDQTFSAIAKNGPKGDAWSIDQDKLLSNITPGCGQ